MGIVRVFDFNAEARGAECAEGICFRCWESWSLGDGCFRGLRRSATEQRRVNTVTSEGTRVDLYGCGQFGETGRLAAPFVATLDQLTAI